MSASYDTLVAKGCICGSERPGPCPLHSAPNDNRGIAAFLRAGMPLAFPMPATCARCGAEGLLYPNVDPTAPRAAADYRPTLVCPRCSRPADEGALIAGVVTSGMHRLNTRRVFTTEQLPLPLEVQHG